LQLQAVDVSHSTVAACRKPREAWWQVLATKLAQACGRRWGSHHRRQAVGFLPSAWGRRWSRGGFWRRSLEKSGEGPRGQGTNGRYGLVYLICSQGGLLGHITHRYIFNFYPGPIHRYALDYTYRICPCFWVNTTITCASNQN
jgi:hypothetical protein